MSIQYSAIISKLSSIKGEKKFKFTSKVGLQTYILYGTIEKNETPRKVRFLMIKRDISCQRIYGVFYFAENEIVSQEIFNPESEKIDVKLLFKEMENTTTINFTCELC